MSFEVLSFALQETVDNGAGLQSHRLPFLFSLAKLLPQLDHYQNFTGTVLILQALALALAQVGRLSCIFCWTSVEAKILKLTLQFQFFLQFDAVEIIVEVYMIVFSSQLFCKFQNNFFAEANFPCYPMWLSNIHLKLLNIAVIAVHSNPHSYPIFCGLSENVSSKA